MEYENCCRTCMQMLKRGSTELTDDMYDFLAHNLGLKSLPKEHPELQLPQVVCSKCNSLIMEFQRFLTKCREVQEYFKTKLEMLSNISNHEDDDDEETIYVESINLIPKEELERTSGIAKINFYDSDEADPIFEILNSDTVSLAEENKIKENRKPTPKPKTKGRKRDCTVCGKSFRNLCQLIDHENIHKGIKPYCCDVCGKCFTQKSTLATHQILHIGKNVKCDECGKKFARNSELILHDRMHRDEKPFVCNFKGCKAEFRESARLMDHQAYHTGVRKFPCDICGNSFFHKKALGSHISKVHPKFIYQCDLCFVWFAIPSRLRNHMNSKHQIQVENVQHLRKRRNEEKNFNLQSAADDDDSQ